MRGRVDSESPRRRNLARRIWCGLVGMGAEAEASKPDELHITDACGNLQHWHCAHQRKEADTVGANTDWGTHKCSGRSRDSSSASESDVMCERSGTAFQLQRNAHVWNPEPGDDSHRQPCRALQSHRMPEVGDRLLGISGWVSPAGSGRRSRSPSAAATGARSVTVKEVRVRDE